MLQPEITPYGDERFSGKEKYSAVLYRFDDAEHIGVEKCEDSITIYASTGLTPDKIEDQYQRAFGIKPSVEPFEGNDADRILALTGVNDGTTPMSVGSIYVGPLTKILADTIDFQLAWLAPHKMFDDREAESAQIHLFQRGGLDFRHEELLRQTVQTNVRQCLTQVLSQF